MKVVLVTSSYLPHTGGLETHVGGLAEGLAGRGHDVTVHTADAGGEGETRENRNGVRVRRHRGLAPGGALHVAPSLIPSIRRAAKNADVVHAHNYHSFPLLFAALGTAGTQAPLVVTPHYHGGSASRVRDALLSPYRPVGRWALGRADRVVAVSNWERDRLRSDFGVEATVVPNGIEVDRFAGATPTDRPRPYLLSVGRLESYKGVQHAIRALAHPDLASYDLVVAGTGSHRAALVRTADEVGVADRVAFLGYVSDEELPSLYAGAEVLVTLSSFEAYGITVGEALATGTPCVVRKAGALADWAERADCIGVDEVAAEDVPEAVREANTRETDPKSLLSWGEICDRTVAIYSRLQRDRLNNGLRR